MSAHGAERGVGLGGGLEVNAGYKFILREKPKQAILAILVQIFFISRGSKQLSVLGVWILGRDGGMGLELQEGED